MEKLLSYQVPHVLQLYECLIENKCVLDGSDTGTGKTYTTIALCKMLNKRPFIISPKSVLSNWINVCEIFDVKIFGLSNYESLINSKYYTENLERVNCPYMDVIEENQDEKKKNTQKEDKKFKTDKKEKKEKKEKKRKIFMFQLPEDVIIIMDEAHKCKNVKTLSSGLMNGISKTSNKLILLSATITDKIETFKPFGVAFGLYNDKKQYSMWMTRQIKMRKIMLKKMNLTDDQIKLKIIHESIYPKFSSRMKIKELGNLFPSNQIIAKSYYIDNHEEVNKLYDELNEALEDLKDKEKRAFALGLIMRIRQRLELIRIPIMLEQAKEGLNKGYSVAIFINFRATMDHLCYHLKCDCTINGDQSIEERETCIDEFQSNKKKIIIATISAGGVGISLHDKNGDHKRMSIISPSWSAIHFVQVLGRIHRAESKSIATQRIIYIAKSYEEDMCRLINTKIQNIQGINDGDLAPVTFTTEIVKHESCTKVLNQDDKK